MKYFLSVILCLLSLVLADTILAGEPPATPFIRINAEMHSSRIMDIATDSRNRFLATASYDKTVKIWETVTGRLINTLRPPVAEGVEGALNAVAFSPEGAIVATAGVTGSTWDKSYCVYLFDVATGEITRRLGGFSNSILRLAFSPDGKRLAVALNNSGGIHIVNLADYKRISDNTAFNGNCLSIVFDFQGNLLAASDDGIIRMYRPDGTPVYSCQSDNGRKIFSLRFSPDGKLFVVGYDDRNTVEVRNTADGSVAFTLNEPKGNLFSVAWSADGQYIMAAGGKQGPDGRKVLIKWSARWKRVDEEIVLPGKSGITQLLPLQDGTIAFVSRQSGFGVISGEGSNANVEYPGKRGGKKKQHSLEHSASDASTVYFHRIAAADFQKNHDSFKISSDANAVLFSYERHGQAKALFDLEKRKLTTDNLPDSGMLAPRFTGNGVDVLSWENSMQPRLNRKQLKGFGSREYSFSLSVMPDDSGIVLGTNHYLRSYAKNGLLLWKKRIPHVAWDVNISADNRTIVAAQDDGTIRWYAMKDGHELYALYLHPDRKRWVLWSPDGFFDHGPGSESLVGYLVNRSAEKASVMIAVDQLYDVFYRPDVIDKIIAGENISLYLQRLTTHLKSAGIANKPSTTDEQKKHENVEAIKREQQAEKERLQQDPAKVEAAVQKVVAPVLPDEVAAAEEPFPNGDAPDTVLSGTLTGLLNSTKLPPRVHFISRSGSSDTRDFTLKAELCDDGGGIGNVTLFINNTPIVFERGERGLAIRDKSTVSICQNLERIITLTAGQNIISLMAFNSDNNIESDRDQITLNYVTADDEKPRLHLLTIAVNNYRDGDLRLKYSINDADGVIRLATEKGQTLFSGIDTYRLHDEQVTKEKMAAIFARIGANTKRGDVFLLFMAGHGVTDETDGMYYFLPVDFRYTGPESFARQGISMNDFKRYLTGIQAMKTLLLVDTCNSGSFSEGTATRGVVDKTAITKLARTVGRATIAASSKNQVALEGYEGHGVFSYTLLEGMKGRAANKKGEITINHLATFIEETLPELTFKKWGYEQIPQKTLIGSDFSIGVK